MKPCTLCNKERWLPENKEVCLQCGFKKSHVEKIAAAKKSAEEEYQKNHPEITIDMF